MRHKGSGLRLAIVFASSLTLLTIAPAVSFGYGADPDVADPNQTLIPKNAPLPHGESFLYGIAAGIGESDNVTLVPTDKVSQTIALVDADIDYKEHSRLFEADAKGSFRYLDYLQNAYSNQLIGRFDGTGRIAIIPERVSWVVQDSFGQAQIDQLQPLTPLNSENVNFLTTGPDAQLRLGPVVFLDMSARYARTTYETNPFDSNRLLGSVSLGRILSARSSVSIDGSYLRVLFDNTVANTDFDRGSIFGHYEITGARTDLSTNLGVTKAEQGAESITAPNLKLEISRKLSADSKLILTIGRDLTDASTGFLNLQAGAIGGIITAAPAITLTNYTVTYGSLGWQYLRNRTTVGLSGIWEKDSYASQPLQDVWRGTAQFNIERKLSREFTAQLLGSVYRTDYTNTGFAETDGLIGAALTYRAGRGLEVKLRYDHASRTVSVAGSGYIENRAILTVGYRPRIAQQDL
jgi:hypothetical protein